MDGESDGERDGDREGLRLALGDCDGERDGERDAEPALITVATRIRAAATSPAFVVALTSRFSLVGIVRAALICALSIFVSVELVTVPPPSACSRVTSEVEPLAASAWK